MNEWMNEWINEWIHEYDFMNDEWYFIRQVHHRGTHHTTLKTTTSNDHLSQFKQVTKARTTLFRFPGLRHLEMKVSQ